MKNTLALGDEMESVLTLKDKMGKVLVFGK